MQYGELVTRSLSIVWRFKYLWLLAILGGADVTAGGGFGGNFGRSGSLGRSQPNGAGSASLGDVSRQVSGFLQDWGGVLVLAGVLVLVLAVAWFLLSCVTVGALVRGSAEHDAGRPFGLGLAWRSGLRTFWSILGLRLIGLVLGLVVLAVVGTFVALGVASYVNGEPGALAGLIALGVMVGLVLAVASVPVGIVFILATRAVVLEELGAVAALGRGVRLLRARLGRTLLVWLLQVGLGIGAGLAVAVVALPVILVSVGAIVAGAVSGGAAGAVAVGIPFGLVLAIVLIVAGGLAGAYLSTYWTLAFRRLELETAQPAPWPPAAYPPTTA